MSAYVLDRAKQEIVIWLRSALPSEVVVSVAELTEPPQRELGDLSYVCFALAKLMKKSPTAVADELAKKFVAGDLVVEAIAVGPYLNFKLERSVFSATVVKDVLNDIDGYGRASEVTGENLLIEYGQPNTHKEVHVGHLRNFFLGLSAVRLSIAAGNKVVPLSYIGDVGAHVAKCLWAYKKFHAGEKPEPGREGKFLGAIYTEASRKVEEDESLKSEVAAVQQALESGDPEWTALWQETRQWSLDEMKAIFAELECDFDRIYFESEVEEPGKQLVKKMLADGIAKLSQGAIIMDLETVGLGVFLLLKSDGNSLYSTKELALAQLKFKQYPDTSTSIHIVDTRQSLYFQQFFETLRRLGFNKRLVHLAYDFVTLKEGAMSSRKGNVITYAELRDDLVSRAASETRQRHADWGEEKILFVARTIAFGAMRFAMLKQDSDKPIVFDPKEALAFEGFTGPYVQYAHARMNSILAKAAATNVASSKQMSSEKFSDEEFAVLRTVAKLPEVVIEAARDFRPSQLANYAFELAQEASAFYRDVSVLNADAADRERRLQIVRALKVALKRTMFLLGIQAPEEM